MSSLLPPAFARDISARGRWPWAGWRAHGRILGSCCGCGTTKELPVGDVWWSASPWRAGMGLVGSLELWLPWPLLKPLRWLSSVTEDQTYKHGAALVAGHSSSQPGVAQGQVTMIPDCPRLGVIGLTWENCRGTWCWWRCCKVRESPGFVVEKFGKRIVWTWNRATTDYCVETNSPIAWSYFKLLFISTGKSGKPGLFYP